MAALSVAEISASAGGIPAFAMAATAHGRLS